jgi:hypothetical protein
MATHDLWLAEFRDSENNLLALMCEKPKGVARLPVKRRGADHAVRFICKAPRKFMP